MPYSGISPEARLLILRRELDTVDRALVVSSVSACAGAVLAACLSALDGGAAPWVVLFSVLMASASCVLVSVRRGVLSDIDSTVVESVMES